jgi:hypothetical protein
MIRRLKPVLAAAFFVAVAAAALVPSAKAKAATSTLSYSQVCQADGKVEVHFFWAGNDPGAVVQWVDLSLFNNGWTAGTFLGFGPLPATQTTIIWNGLIPNAIHYVRVNQLEPEGLWDPSPTFFFTTLDCPSTLSIPAAPSNVVIQGAIPDLSQPVPPGGGELGRITVFWQDNSDNEAGFRFYQECAGVVSPLFEMDANTTSYGPLQTCRPGRIGVAAFNAAGTSAIAWSP